MPNIKMSRETADVLGSILLMNADTICANTQPAHVREKFDELTGALTQAANGNGEAGGSVSIEVTPQTDEEFFADMVQDLEEVAA